MAKKQQPIKPPPIFQDVPKIPLQQPVSPDEPTNDRWHSFEMGAGDQAIHGTEQNGIWAGAKAQADAPFQLETDGSLVIRTFSQAALPTTSQMRPGEVGFWIDTGTSKIYIVIRQGATIKKAELT